MGAAFSSLIQHLPTARLSVEAAPCGRWHFKAAMDQLRGQILLCKFGRRSLASAAQKDQAVQSWLIPGMRPSTARF